MPDFDIPPPMPVPGTGNPPPPSGGGVDIFPGLFTIGRPVPYVPPASVCKPIYDNQQILDALNGLLKIISGPRSNVPPTLKPYQNQEFIIKVENLLFSEMKKSKVVGNTCAPNQFVATSIADADIVLQQDLNDDAKRKIKKCQDDYNVAIRQLNLAGSRISVSYFLTNQKNILRQCVKSASR